MFVVCCLLFEVRGVVCVGWCVWFAVRVCCLLFGGALLVVRGFLSVVCSLLFGLLLVVGCLLFVVLLELSVL